MTLSPNEIIDLAKTKFPSEVVEKIKGTVGFANYRYLTDHVIKAERHFCDSVIRFSLGS